MESEKDTISGSPKSDDLPKKAQDGSGDDTDAYYGEDDMNMEDLDLSFLDEEDEE